MRAAEPTAVGALLVALGGGAGACLRYIVATSWPISAFPWSTVTINVTGSLLLGVLLGAGWRAPTAVALLLGVGVLGGFTTFSTFSLETLELVRSGRSGAALGYVAVSVVAGFAAAAAGFALGARALSGPAG